VELNSSTATLSPAVYEVVLGVTITAKVSGNVAFLVEVKYGGVFTLKGFADEQLKQLLGSYCPAVLFPFVREIVSDTVVRGGFPQLILAPINFDAVYAEQQKQHQE
jgi:preprotein translocase subunit SecB